MITYPRTGIVSSKFVVYQYIAIVRRHLLTPNAVFYESKNIEKKKTPVEFTVTTEKRFAASLRSIRNRRWRAGEGWG